MCTQVSVFNLRSINSGKNRWGGNSIAFYVLFVRMLRAASLHTLLTDSFIVTIRVKEKRFQRRQHKNVYLLFACIFLKMCKKKVI